MKYRSLLIVIALIAPLSTSGKRIAPPIVNPVVLNGVEYSAEGDGTHAWITATDIATRKELWRAKVFHIRTHWWKGEEDNQWIYISSLKLDRNTLLIEDERCKCYRLDLNMRRVHSIHCSTPAAQNCR